MATDSAKPSFFNRSWLYPLLSLGILGLALWLRVHDLYNLPIFFDESSHVDWAIRFSANNPGYPFLMDGKFLLGVYVALLHLTGPGALWLGRAALGLMGVLSCAASLGLARYLAGRGAGLWAGLAYAVLPQAILFERQVLADPLMSGLGLLVIVLAYRLARRWQWRTALAFAVALAACVVAKLFGLIYLAFPVFIGLLLVKRANRWALLMKYAITLALAALIGGAFLLSLWPRLGYNDSHLASQQIGFVGCPPIVCGFKVGDQLNNLQGFVGALNEEALPYYGWPVLLLAVLAVPLALPHQRRAVGVFALASLAMLVGFALTAKGYVPPRYMIFMAAPFTVLAGVAVAPLIERLATSSARVATGVIVTIGMLLWPGLNGLRITLDPAHAQMTNLDREGFYAPSAGEGIRDAAFSLAIQQHADPPPVILTGNIPFSMVAAYFDRSRVDVRTLGETHPLDLGNWLANGQEVFVFNAPDQTQADGLDLQPLGLYPQGPGTPPTASLGRVTSLGPELRAQLYRNIFIEPEKLTEDYQNFIAGLPGDHPITVLVYPPNQAPVVTALAATQANVTVVAVGDIWPLNEAAVTTELGTATLNQSDVRILFSEETKGDPRHVIENWLNTYLFRLAETWFGPVRSLAYAGEGPVAQSLPIAGKFGDGLQLDRLDIVDAQASPGGQVRLRLVWQALAPVAEPYKIFTHIYEGDHILAQHDGQPVGELRPTTTWQPGESIVDQFAIQLPPDAPAGIYQLRVGVYNLNTQARLPLLLPDGTQAEFFVGGAIEIK